MQMTRKCLVLYKLRAHIEFIITPLFLPFTFMDTCTIPANPDISGIGVRAAIYAQNLLSFVPAFYALIDGTVDEQELKTIEDQSTSILVTAFAILISAIVQIRTYGLSSFHTYVILCMSWMNNTNTFIYFILYVHRNEEKMLSRWRSWIHHLRLFVTFSSRSNQDIEMSNQDGLSFH
jgi:hypothetical protein